MLFSYHNYTLQKQNHTGYRSVIHIYFAYSDLLFIERRGILGKHLSADDKVLSKSEIDKSAKVHHSKLGYPQCCAIFVSKDAFMIIGSQFFERPIGTYSTLQGNEHGTVRCSSNYISYAYRVHNIVFCLFVLYRYTIYVYDIQLWYDHTVYSYHKPLSYMRTV